jgi:hypothetical protein
MDMKTYSYVVTSDSGFAPNPLWGYCTLATCKPKIRRVAKKDDWAIGTGSVKNVGNCRLIYAMKITEVMKLEDYGEENRFFNKIPSKGIKKEKGDNIYYRDRNGIIRQRFPSMHSYPERENLKLRERDLKGKNVLISEAGNFYYFGKVAPKIPENLLCLVKKGPNHKCGFQQGMIDSFLRWIEGMKAGVYGQLYDFGGR